MKLIMVIMTAILTQSSASGLTQRITFNKKDASLKTVFKEITRQTGYQVIYGGSLVKEAPQPTTITKRKYPCKEGKF